VDLQAPQLTSWVISARYLDCTRTRNSLPLAMPADLPLPAALRGMTQDEKRRRQDVESYLRGIDPWMPLIPRSYLRKLMSSAEAPQTSGSLLLLACIMLLVDPCSGDDAYTSNYVAAKLAFVHVEAAGAFTLQIVQARFLLLLYEFGHGILQAAYVSIDACMRSLDAVSRGESGDFAGPWSWMFEEQMRRLWWVGFVLDR
jgi:hypothetical protein